MPFAAMTVLAHTTARTVSPTPKAASNVEVSNRRVRLLALDRLSAMLSNSSVGRFDPFAKPSANDRSLRIAVVHCVVYAPQEFPHSAFV